MVKVLEYFLLAVFIAGAMLLSHWVGQQAYTWMPPQATAEAQRVDDLFSFLVSIGTLVVLGLVGMMLSSFEQNRMITAIAITKFIAAAIKDSSALRLTIW